MLSTDERTGAEGMIAALILRNILAFIVFVVVVVGGVLWLGKHD
jgi:hypothetical protein